LFIRQMQQFQLDKRQIVCLSRIRIRTPIRFYIRIRICQLGGWTSAGPLQVGVQLCEKCGRGMCVTREIQFPQTGRLGG